MMGRVIVLDEGDRLSFVGSLPDALEYALLSIGTVYEEVTDEPDARDKKIAELRVVVDKLPDIAAIQGVIVTLRKSKRSHEQWAEYRQKNEKDNPDAGDRAFHLECKSEYTEALSVMKSVCEAAQPAKSEANNGS